MIVEIRNTAQGTEYWDTELKKTVFVPAGKEPSFEITVNPVSMLTVKDGPVTSFTTMSKSYGDMTPKELKAYAAKNNVSIPSNVKTKSELIKFITESESALGSYVDDGASVADDDE